MYQKIDIPNIRKTPRIPLIRSTSLPPAGEGQVGGNRNKRGKARLGHLIKEIMAISLLENITQ